MWIRERRGGAFSATEHSAAVHRQELRSGRRVPIAVPGLDQSVVAGQGCVAGTDASRVSSEVLRCLYRPYRWQASSHSELQ